jgi:hypothetical protein
MHTYHRLAVVADNADEAKAIALNFAEDQQWSDWCSLPEDSKFSDIKVATNYTSDRQEFAKLVEQATKWTTETVTKVVEEYGDITLKDILTNPKYTFEHGDKRPITELAEEEKDERLKNSLGLFRVGKALSVLNEDYSAETMFYDTVEYTITPKYLQERLLSDPDTQWIVIVDYHF